MADGVMDFFCRHVPGVARLTRLPRQVAGRNPFDGDIRTSRVRLFSPGSGRPTLPFPHPWNYQQPIRILETYFWDAESQEGSARHNRYLDVPGFAPVLVTRDPAVIRAIATDTGANTGQFDRDTLPSTGIARATGKDTLLYANGPRWKRQKKLAMPPFGRTTLFQPEQFHRFAQTFRETVRDRLTALEELHKTASSPVRVRLEPEIQVVMLEMLVNNFFGLDVPYEQIRDRYVPALQRVIDHIVRDTVINKLGVPLWAVPGVTRVAAEVKRARAHFEELTDRVLGARKDAKGLWGQFKADAPDRALRSNIRVFLAGALEATTSYACWAISHLARDPEAQDKLYHVVEEIDDYTPENLENAGYLSHVLDETLRLTPSLYFFPRRATEDTWVQTTAGSRLRVPRGTHILLDVWHANRLEEHWGVDVTGYPASRFAPERWEGLTAPVRNEKNLLHFGFGHGPRVCPGKHLGQLEVALVVGAFVKLFRFDAIAADNPPRAGVSTKPADGTTVDLRRR